jgi:hypothetical protein
LEITMAKEKTIRFIDNPEAPEVFASAATGFFVANGNITITFESARADHAESPGPVFRTVVARVVIPAQGAQALAIGLFDFLEKQGFDFKRNQ